MKSQRDGSTVFLTEQEAERIRKTVKDKLEKCSKLAGHAREPRDSKTAMQQATGASLMADMSGGSEDALPALSVGHPYPPCIISLKDLEPMKLTDLKMETHHRGRSLTVKRASPVVTLTARSWAMVQGEKEDDVERLEVCLHKSRHGEDILESAKLFVIKEPYFTFTDDGEATIRIDHPSDLLICGDEKLETNLNSHGHTKDASVAEEQAKKCKDKGNAALKKNDLSLAYAKYTEGLKFARQDSVTKINSDLARDIFRNRAHVNLLVSQIDEAKSDANASLIGTTDGRSKQLDSKAYFRAGCAAYNLGEYQEAKAYFEEQQKLVPDDKDASINLKRIELRLREQEKGIYNFKKIRAGLSQARPRADAASFINNAEVKDSPGRGRGLFATRCITAGEIVMCEKAFCVVWGHESEALTAMTYDVRDDRIRVSPAGLSKAIVQKLVNNPSQIKRVMDLYGDYQGDGKTVSKTEDGAIVDTFRVHDIMSRNAFGPGEQYGEEGARHVSTGLWIWAAYINHSCIGNAKKECVGDLMILRAVRPITAGEEIFHSYDESSDYDARQKALMTTWGFECNCALCVVEKADDPAVRGKRRELASEVDAFMEREHWANAKRLTLVKAQRLARAINDTYDAERYADVPRVAVQGIQEWLSKASPRR